MILKIFDYFQDKKTVLTLGSLGLFLLAGALIFFNLKIQTDIVKFLPKGVKSVDNYKKIFTHFKLLDKLFFMISTKAGVESDPDLLIDYGNELYNNLLALKSKRIERIFYQFDDEDSDQLFSHLIRSLPIYMNAKDQSQFKTKVSPEAIEKNFENAKKTKKI